MRLAAVPTRSQGGRYHSEYKRKQPPSREVQRGGDGCREKGLDAEWAGSPGDLSIPHGGQVT